MNSTIDEKVVALEILLTQHYCFTQVHKSADINADFSSVTKHLVKAFS